MISIVGPPHRPALVIDAKGEPTSSTITLVPVGRVTTTVVRLEGPAGAEAALRCAICNGRVCVGDEAFLTAQGSLVHALSHYPDCVNALTREARDGR